VVVLDTPCPHQQAGVEEEAVMELVVAVALAR